MCIRDSLDTEAGSDFVLPLFKKESIEVVSCKSRAFVDLLSVIDEAEKNCDILIIDSITHFWTELMSAYMKKKNIDRLIIRDWGILKPEWRQFTDMYLTSKLHIIMCGRAGWDFGYEENERGEKEFVKSGTKMRVETETGFEPSLNVEMESIRVEKGKIGSGFVNRMWILKDRSNTINGRYFDNPDFKCILPHIETLNLKAKHNILNTKRTSEEIFSSRDKAMAEYYKQRDIVCEEIKDELVLRFGRGQEGQKEKINTLKSIFGTSSWTKITNLNLEDIKKGLEKIKNIPINEGGK